MLSVVWQLEGDRKQLIVSAEMFADADEGLVQSVVLMMKEQVCLPADCIMRIGERGDEMFFISRGTVGVYLSHDVLVSSPVHRMFPSSRSTPCTPNGFPSAASITHPCICRWPL